jgi:hypothetical protein
MLTNESTLDRIIRLIIGVVFIILGFVTWNGVGGIILGIVGIVLTITGITGFCLLYRVFGVSTRKTEKKS